MTTGNITFANASGKNYTITGGDITAAGNVVFSNGGNVTFSNGNLSFANTFTVNATGSGKVTIANSGTLVLPATTAVNSGILAFAHLSDQSYSTNFTGSGTVQKEGSSSIATLSGNNSGFTGTIKVVDGTLKAGSTTALGGTGSVTVVSSGATLDLNGTILVGGTANLIGTGVSGLGALYNSSTSSAVVQNVILSGDATIGAGGTGFNVGAYFGPAVNGTGSFVGNNHNLTVNATFEIDFKNVGEIGVNNLIVTGGKPLYFAGSTSVTGAGEIQLVNGSQLGLYGSGFFDNGFDTSTGVVSKTIRVVSGGAFEIYRGNATFDSAIILDSDFSITNYTREGNSTNPTTTLTGPITGAGNFFVHLNSNSGTTSRVGTVALTSDNNTYAGTTTIGGGGGHLGTGPANDQIRLSIGNGGATGSIGAGAITVNGGAGIGTAVLQFNRNNSLVIANDIHGAGNVEQLGTGTTTLSGAVLDYTGNTTVSAGTLNITGSHTSGTNYSVTSGANLITNNVRVTNALTVDGTVTVNANGGVNGASRVETLAISAGGKLNLKDNDLVVGTTADVNAVRDAIKLGLTGTAGITSDLPAFATTTGFGYALGSDPNISPLLAGSLSGQSYDTDSVLVKYTFLGDADLDGDSDLNDLGLWAQSFTGDLGNPVNPATYWTSGDFDYDGDTDLNDLGFWAGTFTGDLGGGAGSLIVHAPNAPAGAVAALSSMGITVVPEPSTFVLAGVGLAGLAIAARRKQK